MIHPRVAPRLVALLNEGLAELGSPAADSPPLLAALAELALLLSEWGQRMSLTGHRTPEAVVRRLVLDAAALDCALVPPPESLVDIGSGAGFPGLPIAILHPERRVTLLEARERRHHFQRMAVRALGLENVETLLGRAESLVPSPHDLALAQALAAPRRAVGLLLPWVRPGGWLLLPGGAAPPVVPPREEIESDRVVQYHVPLRGPMRSLWMGRKRS